MSEKDVENWLIFGEVMGRSLVSCFLTHGVVGYTLASVSVYIMYVHVVNHTKPVNAYIVYDIHRS